MFEWDKIERAKTLMESPKLREEMQKAGVVGKPEISFLNSSDKGTL